MDREFVSWGFYRFYPDKDKKNLRYKLNSFWATIDVDKEITNYYFNLLQKENPQLKLKKPDRSPHITVCKGEKLRNFQKEGKYLARKLKQKETKCVTFTYSNNIETNGTHFYLKVNSKELEDFRQYLGLSKRLKYDFHITIAKVIK